MLPTGCTAVPHDKSFMEIDTQYMITQRFFLGVWKERPVEKNEKIERRNEKGRSTSARIYEGAAV